MLGEQKQAYMWHEVSRTFCRPNALRSKQEGDLLVSTLSRPPDTLNF